MQGTGLGITHFAYTWMGFFEKTGGYWRVVVPDNVGNKDVKNKLLTEIHSVPYAGHPGYNRTLEVARVCVIGFPTGSRRGMAGDVREFVVECPVCIGKLKKGNLSAPPRGQLQNLKIPEKKWTQYEISLDFIVKMPKTNKGNDAVLVVRGLH